MSIDATLANLAAAMKQDGHEISLPLILEGKQILEGKISVVDSIKISLLRLIESGVIPKTPSENPLLKNRLGIADAENLKLAEKEIVFKRLAGLERSNMLDLSVETLRDINQTLYGDIFHFAGSYRTKDRSGHLPVKELRSALNALVNKISSVGEGLDHDQLVAVTSYFMMELEYISPFVLGNFTTINKYLSIFSRINSLKFDLYKINAEDLKSARESAAQEKEVQPLFNTFSLIMN